MATHRDPRKGPVDRTPLTGRLVVTSNPPRGGKGCDTCSCSVAGSAAARMLAVPTTRPVVFLHAHPDDEAIFSGGTLRLLRDAGIPAVVVFATNGELGEDPHGSGEELGAQRRAECVAAAEVLGTLPPRFLGYRDSGLHTPSPPLSLAATPVARVAEELAALLRELDADTLVSYDPKGIYGHPDHLAVHAIGRDAAARVGLATVYEATVDSEYLHFVETHLVEEAQLARSGPDLLPGLPDLGDNAGASALARDTFGTPTVLVDLVVDARRVIDTKRAAMATHVSQIPPGSSALRLKPAAFSEVYGLEWYLRMGPPGALDMLPRR